MNAGALAVRADAGAAIGAGHVMRSLALADAWHRHGGTVDWFCAPLPPMLGELLQTRPIRVHTLGHADDWGPILAWIAAHPNAWVSIDGYGFCAGVEKLHTGGARVAVIDDDGRWPRYDCSLLVNQNLGADRIEYQSPPATRKLLGTEFVLLRNEFRRRPRAARDASRPARRVFVSFGGHDVRGLTAHIVQLLTRAVPDLELDVTAGVMAAAAAMASTRVRWHAGTDLSMVMCQADLALVAAGSVCWELAYLGVPALTVIVAANQEAVASGLQEAGVARDLGWFDKLTDAAVVDAVDALRFDPARAEMSARGQALIDGAGADRVVAAMLQ